MHLGERLAMGHEGSLQILLDALLRVKAGADVQGFLRRSEAAAIA